MKSQQIPPNPAVQKRYTPPSVCPAVIDEAPEGIRIDAGIPSQPEGLFGSATDAMAQAIPQNASRQEANTRLLRQAGYLSKSAPVDFAALRYALTICAVLLLGTALVLVETELEPFILGGLVTIPFLMWLIPASIVERQAARRNEQIARGIPDLMSLIGICVRQGMHVPEAFHQAAFDLREAYPAIAQEAAVVRADSHVNTFANALRSFRDRISLPEVGALTSVLIQSSELGTGVSDSLEKNSRNLRELQRERRHANARLTPQKIIVPTLFFLLPAALIVFNVPAITEYFAPLNEAIIRPFGP